MLSSCRSLIRPGWLGGLLRQLKGTARRYVRVLIAVPLIQEEQCSFCLVMEHWTTFIPSKGCLSVHGRSPNQSSCALLLCLFCTWRRCLTVYLWVVLWEHEFQGPLLRSFWSTRAEVWFALLAVRQTCSQLIIFMYRIYFIFSEQSRTAFTHA